MDLIGFGVTIREILRVQILNAESAKSSKMLYFQGLISC